jgi:Terminase RNaseH-like domain
LKRAVREQCEAFVTSVVLIEDKASGTQLIQELIQEGLHAITRYQPQSDKIMRMHAQTATIENGFMHLPKDAGWLAEYPHELTVFPNGKHDDQGRRNRPDARLVQAGRPRPQLQRGDLAFLQPTLRSPAGGASQTERPDPSSVMAKRLGLLRSL